MNDHRNPDELLKDVFAQPDSFRSELLGKTLSAVQRKRRLQRLRIRLSASALVIATALAAFKIFLRTDSSPSGPAPTYSNPLYVHSQPLPASMLITTATTIPVLIHSSSAISIFQTTSQETYERIGEDKLFSLLGDRPAMVIHRGPGDTSFRFVNADDQAGWPVQ